MKVIPRYDKIDIKYKNPDPRCGFTFDVTRGFQCPLYVYQVDEVPGFDDITSSCKAHCKYWREVR